MRKQEVIALGRRRGKTESAMALVLNMARPANRSQLTKAEVSAVTRVGARHLDDLLGRIDDLIVEMRESLEQFLGHPPIELAHLDMPNLPGVRLPNGMYMPRYLAERLLKK